MGFLIISLPWMLDRFDLPASLMPREYILDLSHYAQAIGRLLASADKMGVSTVRGWFSRSYEFFCRDSWNGRTSVCPDHRTVKPTLQIKVKKRHKVTAYAADCGAAQAAPRFFAGAQGSHAQVFLHIDKFCHIAYHQIKYEKLLI